MMGARQQNPSKVISLANGQWLSILGSLAPKLTPAIDRLGRHGPCPIHGGKDGFRLFPDANETGGGICNCAGGNHIGSGIRLLMWLQGWTEDETVQRIAQHLGMDEDPQPSQVYTAAQAWCDLARPDDGTISTYLRERGLSGQVPDSLKLLPTHRYVDEGHELGRYPVMLAAYRNAVGEVIGLHRTYLALGGHGKADVNSPKKNWRIAHQGALNGSAIRLGQADGLLGITEGIETALAVMEATGIPVWATGSANGLERVEIPSTVHRVEIWADADSSGRGQAAARRLEERLSAIGYDVLVVSPPALDEDWLDVFRRSGSEALLMAQKSAATAPKPNAAARRTISFPLDVFPMTLSRYIEETATVNNHLPDFLAVSALCLAGAAIGCSRVLVLRAGYLAIPSMFAVLVGRSGTGKTPALNVMAQHFYDRQAELLEQSEQNSPEARPSRMPQLGHEKAAIDPSPRKLGVVTDATVEALAIALQDNPRGVVMVLDELSSLVDGLNQYKGGRGADRQRYLSAWSGAAIYGIRRGSPAVVAPTPRVSIIGCMTPGQLKRLRNQDDDTDGLAERFLYAYSDAPHQARTWRSSAEAPDPKAFGDLLNQLWSLQPERRPGQTTRPLELRLTGPGEAEWACNYNKHYATSQQIPPAMLPAWSKLEVYAGRMALVLHLLRWAAGEASSEAVDETSVQGAWTLVDYFWDNYRRVHKYTTSDRIDQQSEAVLQWMKSRGSQGCTARDMQRAEVAGIKGSSDAHRLIQLMVDRGYGICVQRGHTTEFRPFEENCQ